jgi:glycosyltransferase involved in cell wall biosynthesis
MVMWVGLQEDPRPFFWTADLAINTSLHDSFNLSLAESMACGLPILTTNTVGISELPGVSNAGLFFPVSGINLEQLRGDAEETPMHMNESMDQILGWVDALLNSDGQAQQHSHAARDTIERFLAPPVIAREWYDLLAPS